MASLNRVQLLGNLGKDPELAYTKSQLPYAKFSVATTEKPKDRDPITTWHRVIVWGKQAEIAHKYLKKGQQLFLEGRIEYSEHDGKHYTTINVDRFIMLGGGKGQTLLDSENGRPARLPGGSNEAPTSQYRDVWEMGKPGASFELNNTANRLTKEDVCMRKGTQKLQALKSPLQIMAC